MPDKVLLLVDWDNLFFSLFSRFNLTEMHIMERLQELLIWVEKDLGELLGGHGFVFAPEHLSIMHQEICTSLGFKLIICPKIRLKESRANPKTGNQETEQDTVDEAISWFAKMMAGHKELEIICLVSGDNDFVPLFEEMGKLKIKRALAPPTIDCLAKTKELISLVDPNPKNNQKMLFMLDEIAV